MHLSVPIDIIRFCLGGSEITTVGIVRVQDDRTEAQVLTQGGKAASADATSNERVSYKNAEA